MAPSAVPGSDATAVRELSVRGEGLGGGGRAARFEVVGPRLERVENGAEDVSAIHRSPELATNGGGPILDFRREVEPVDIDPNPNHHVLGAGSCARHLREDSRHLAPPSPTIDELHIVRPFQPRRQPQRPQRIRDRRAHDQSDGGMSAADRADRSTIENVRFSPALECHVRPSRPRPAVCSSAAITNPPGAPSRARVAARSFVDEHRSCHSYLRANHRVRSRAARLSAVGAASAGSTAMGGGQLATARRRAVVLR